MKASALWVLSAAVSAAACIETVPRVDPGSLQDAAVRGGADRGLGGTDAEMGAPVGGEGAGGDSPAAGTSGGGGEGAGGLAAGGAKPEDDAGPSTGGGNVPPAGGEAGMGGQVSPPSGGDAPPPGGQAGVGGGSPPAGGAAPPVGGEAPPPAPQGDVTYARISVAEIADARDPACADHDGDGDPDNGFGALGGLANGQLQDALDSGALTLLPTAIGLPAGRADGQFAVAVLTGDSDGQGGYTVAPEALDANGEPLILFNPAQRQALRLVAGPSDFLLSLPVQGVQLDLRLTDTQLTASRIQSPGGTDLEVDDGVLSGVLTQADLNQALQVLPPAIVGLVPLLLQPDVDLDRDGRADAYSLCLTFTAVPAQVSGYPLP